METTTNKTLAQMEAELQEAEATFAQSLATLRAHGVELPNELLDMAEWVSIKRYAEEHELSTQVVTNWIARGIIPADCVRQVPELNDLRLIKNQSYRQP